MTELFAEFENQSDLGDRMILDAFQGVTLAFAKPDRLWHEAVVLFGPEMTAQNAVLALRRLADEIVQAGMLIGRQDQDRDFGVETIDGLRRI